MQNTDLQGLHKCLHLDAVLHSGGGSSRECWDAAGSTGSVSGRGSRGLFYEPHWEKGQGA